MPESGQVSLEVRNASFSYPNSNVKVLDKVSFEVREGEIVCIAGPNGCGKTTLLNLIAGFLKPNSGEVRFHNNGFCRIVFQQLGLLDWKTAKENVELALLSQGLAKEPREKIVQDCLKLCRLESEEGKLPKELSGGMKQRVAICRALAARPSLLLLDEPFSSLDQQTRRRLQKDIFRIARETKTSVIIVTHHLSETLRHADRFLELGNGRIQEKPVKAKA